MLLQIDYLIYFANIAGKSNIIYWSLIKIKQVIYSLLVAELYRIAYKFNIKAIIKEILAKIFRFVIGLIYYTDLKFLYDCLVKLGTVQAKKFIINMINLP